MSIEATAVESVESNVLTQEIQQQYLLDSNNDGNISGTEFRNYFYSMLASGTENASSETTESSTQSSSGKLMDLLVPLAVELIASYLEKNSSGSSAVDGSSSSGSQDAVNFSEVTFDQQGRTDFNPQTDIQIDAHSFDGKVFRFDESKQNADDYWRVFYSVDGKDFVWVDDSSDGLNISGEGEFNYAMAVRKSGGRTPIVGIDQ